jgi:mRNA interferase MazF
MSEASRSGLLFEFVAGLDWEPNKTRPCIVVEDTELFGNHANVIVVPLTHDADVAPLSLAIDPTPENGCPDRCFALSAHVSSLSRTCIVRATSSHITDQQLARIRDQIALCIRAA